MLHFLSRRVIIYTGGAEKNPKFIYFVTWTMALILCLFLLKKCLELVYVTHSSFKLDYTLSHCYYFCQVLVRKEKLIIIFAGVPTPPAAAICLTAHTPTCSSAPLSDSSSVVCFGSEARELSLLSLHPKSADF